MTYKRILALLLALCMLSFSGCNSDPKPNSSSKPPMAAPTHHSVSSAASTESKPEEVESQPEPAEESQPVVIESDLGETGESSEDSGDVVYYLGSYEAPPLATAVFHDTNAVDGVRIDLSSTSEGYVAVAVEADARVKFQVLKDDLTYTYNMASDGTPSFFPLQSGSGTYTFKVMENVEDTKYAEKYSVDAEVSLADEFQPFIRPSDYVDYTENSQCVKLAQDLAAGCDSELDVVGAVFDYICENIDYDNEKAATVKTGYLPNPDETLMSGKGICFDYASLAAAMLRSEGIPTKVIFGYVSPNDLYHAWNMFYTEETGWVTVDYQVSEDTWNRLDLTFAANGADENFIGDGTNYTDVYVY